MKRLSEFSLFFHALFCPFLSTRIKGQVFFNELPEENKHMRRHSFLRLGAATALALTGIATITNTKPASAANYKNVLKRVRVNYLAGYGIKIWSNYRRGTFTGMRAHDGTTWNVTRSIVDRKGRLWYQIGPGQWIQARYTVDLPQKRVKSRRQHRVKRIVNITTKKLRRRRKKRKQTKINTAQTVKPVKPVKPAKVKPVVPVKTKTKKKRSRVKKPVSQASKKIRTKRRHKASAWARALVRLAKKQLGKNYVWGGNGPDRNGNGGFDCSGLICYLYAHVLGRNLPRTTYDQVKVGKTIYLTGNKAVDQKKLRAGDLLFFGSATAPGHVALYIGNGQYIDAEDPQDGVVLRNMSSYFYPVVAKRIF